MLKNIFLKTLYEKRWMIVFWSLGVAAMALLMMTFYPSFSGGGFDEALESLPESFQGLVGDLTSLKSVAGYVAQQVFALRIPLLTLIMGVTLFSALIAGDESEGTLQSLLVQPVSRARVFIQKFLAGLVISFIITSAAIIGVLVGLLIIQEQMSFVRLLQSVIGAWLLTVVFGSMGFALGAITGKRGLSGSIAGLLAFSSYLLTSFAGSVASIATLEKFSPFHYYNNPAIAQYGLDGGNVLIMVAITATLVIVSMAVFVKRDVYQR